VGSYAKTSLLFSWVLLQAACGMLSTVEMPFQSEESSSPRPDTIDAEQGRLWAQRPTPEFLQTGVYSALLLPQGNVREASLWLDGQWTALPITGSFEDVAIHGVSVGPDQLIVAGTVYLPLSRKKAGFWTNGVWSDLQGEVLNNSTGTGLAVRGSEVIVSGNQWAEDNSIRGVVWISSVRQVLAIPGGALGSRTHGVRTSASDVYVLGSIQFPGESPTEIGFWRSGVWNGLPNPTGYRPAAPVSMAMDPQQRLIVVANFYDSANKLNIGVWRAGRWMMLSRPAEADRAQATSLALDGDVVFVTGGIGSGSSFRPGLWRNGYWIELPLPEGASAGTSFGSFADQGNLHSYGFVRPLGGQPQPGVWRNLQWHPLTLPSGYRNGIVVGLTSSSTGG